MARQDLTPEQRARRGRNLALALGLAAFVIIVFVTTIVRLGGNVFDRAPI
jgi:hypothetical protein